MNSIMVPKPIDGFLPFDYSVSTRSTVAHVEPHMSTTLVVFVPFPEATTGERVHVWHEYPGRETYITTTFVVK